MKLVGATREGGGKETRALKPPSMQREREREGSPAHTDSRAVGRGAVGWLQALIIFGAVVDEEALAPGEVSITLIATGFGAMPGETLPSFMREAAPPVRAC